MAKGTRGKRRIASRRTRSTPYPMLAGTQKLWEDPNGKKSSTAIVMPKKDLEDITCSVCMEHPHNAVLLLCSSHDKGCRPYMCGTSSRYSNCLDQYKKAASPEPFSGWPEELACPLCRGQVKGWTVVECAREYLNGKQRSCMHEECSFVGAYKDLKKHVRSEHPCGKPPREVDPHQEEKWRRLEREREREDVISTVTSSMPGSVVFGDYVIERTPYGLESDEEEEEEENRGLDVGSDGGLVNVFLLFHAFGQGARSTLDVGDDGEDGDGLVSPLHRQGRVLLGGSGRRRGHRGGQT